MEQSYQAVFHALKYMFIYDFLFFAIFGSQIILSYQVALLVLSTLYCHIL